MKIYFQEFKDEIDTLIEFLTSDTWEFHGIPNPKPESIRASYENQYYNGDDCKTFWIALDQDTKVGMIRIYDLYDDTPLFDIRILNNYKGMGIGTIAVKWISSYIFNNFPNTERIEGNTREDNYAMRCVFHKCAFVKEAHFRKAWPSKDGKLYDAIGYGIIKVDWASGQVTPVNWNDFKY
ncbi:GNAT family N-acetyltransferase [uncultured Clostridium sp.]|uniref:GNAT family N-acetyltransferase n=1 Tax=uncultured Clostridium sp. TaxID=59620 RepID=UPI0028EFC0DB|nr:GNAT family N-acetyltransferase [uncultured Clostridium sp.]